MTKEEMKLLTEAILPTPKEVIEAYAEIARNDYKYMLRKEIFGEIEKERAYQEEKWGTKFDDKNTVNDWGTYINIYLAKATDMGASKAQQRTGMAKVAALAVAALESFDRNKGFALRHYDAK
jgi:hypothetical protein